MPSANSRSTSLLQLNNEQGPGTQFLARFNGHYITKGKEKLSKRITWRVILIMLFFNVLIIGAVRQFVGETEQSDDLTMLAIKYTKG